MAKNINHVSHIKSKQIVDGKPKLPEASSLIEGEIAINFAEGVETISTKNESGNVVTFSSDDYYTSKKLGSGFTGENSGRTVTEAIEEATATVDQVIDSGTSASTNAVSTSAVYGFVTSYTPSITVDQVLDNTTSASTNPVSSKAVYKAVTDNELVWTNAFVELSGVTSAHTENTDIHVTTSDKTAWNAKLDASAIVNFFDDAKYEDSGTTKVINFYHGSTIKATIDASDFIVDGMVDDVRIENGNLVIDFNTESGKQDISIPLTDIFDPSNYYNKTAIDSLVGSGFTSSSITEVIIENEEITSAALTDLDERKLDATAYTPTDLSNYYTKSETSGKTEIQNALTAKTDTATTTALNNVVTAHTGNTDIHVTTGDKSTWNAVTAKTDNSEFTAHTANTTVHVTAAERTSWNTAASGVTDLSGQSETIATALVDLNTNKADKSTTLSGYGIADAYTKTEIDNMIGNIETLLAAI